MIRSGRGMTDFTEIPRPAQPLFADFAKKQPAQGRLQGGVGYPYQCRGWWGENGYSAWVIVLFTPPR